MADFVVGNVNSSCDGGALLFKRGAWFAERPEPRDGEASAAAASFKDAATQAAVDLNRFLVKRTLSRFQLGPRSLGHMGQCFHFPRKGKYPRRLVGLGSRNFDQQREQANLFFAEKPYCLDCFSYKLRLAIPTAVQLLDAKTLEFLDAVLDRVVPTSASIERAFAR